MWKKKLLIIKHTESEEKNQKQLNYKILQDKNVELKNATWAEWIDRIFNLNMKQMCS